MSTSLLSLSPEIIHVIVGEHLPLSAFLSLSHTCRSLRQAVHYNLVKRLPCRKQQWRLTGQRLRNIQLDISNRPMDSAFGEFADNILPLLCVSCGDNVETYEHPVLSCTLICRACTINREEYAVIRLCDAYKQYHFTPKELRWYPLRLSKTFNAFTDARCKFDNWVMVTDIRKIALEIYGTADPQPRDVAKEMNRKRGGKKRALRCQWKREVQATLLTMGYHEAEVSRLVETSIWTQRFPMCFGNLFDPNSIKLDVSIESYTRECIVVLQQLRSDFYEYTRFEDDLQRYLRDNGVMEARAQLYLESADFIQNNPYSFHPYILEFQTCRGKIPEIFDRILHRLRVEPTPLYTNAVDTARRRKPIGPF